MSLSTKISTADPAEQLRIAKAKMAAFQAQRQASKKQLLSIFEVEHKDPKIELLQRIASLLAKALDEETF
jgi:hypothetical protein